MNTAREIETFAKNFHSCQSLRNIPVPTPLHPWSWPFSPWHWVHIDFAGLFFRKTLPHHCWCSVGRSDSYEHKICREDCRQTEETICYTWSTLLTWINIRQEWRKVLVKFKRELSFSSWYLKIKNSPRAVCVYVHVHKCIHAHLVVFMHWCIYVRMWVWVSEMVQPWKHWRDVNVEYVSIQHV